MPTRVIFLDFDGVIITPRACTALDPIRKGEICAKNANRADPVAIAAIAAVCATGVRIVVSSSWRKMEEQCRHILRENGLEQFLHPDWRTREDRYLLAGGVLDRRGNQIADWLAAHPEVRSYRILDDSNEMLPMQSPYFVLCHAFDGLGYYHIKRLIDWANGEEEAA